MFVPLALAWSQVHADKVATTGAPDPSPAAPEKCDCACEYRKNKCDAFARTLAPNEKDKLLRCDYPTDQIDLANDPIAGCLHGVADASILALLNLPVQTANAVMDATACSADPVAKLMILRGTSHTFEPAMIRTMIDKWSCADITREVQNREETIQKNIADKQLAMRTQIEAKGISVDPAIADALVRSQLPDRERKYLEAKGPKGDPGAGLRNKYGNLWNCFSPHERLRKFCDDVSTAALLIGGVAGVSKAAAAATARAEAQQMAKLAERAKAAAEAERLAKRNAEEARIRAKGPRYDWLRDGNWLERHYTDLPEPLRKQFTNLPERYQLYGPDITYKNPFPGADSMLVGKNGPNRSPSRGAARERVIKAAEESGLNLSLGAWRDGFVGLSDPAKMSEFLRRMQAVETAE